MTAQIAPARAASTASRPPELTVVVPCYNERPNVAPLVDALDAALTGIAWEVLFVDDDSPDGTTEEARRLASLDPRVRCIRRIGRRGLASAVMEGALASSAPFIAVMDGDLQHDETRLPAMLAVLRDGACDLVVASRHVEGGDNAGLSSRFRRRLSDAGIGLAQRVLPVRLSDPMSGFFMLPRPWFEAVAPRLTGRGFKILLDLVLSAPTPPRVVEVPARFRARVAGESKLDVLVLAQFASLLLDKLLGGWVPLRFVAFAAVGALGLCVHLSVLFLSSGLGGLDFERAQVLATIVAMVFNFQLNNQITYRDQRLKGARFWRGLALFMVVCGLGAAAGVGIARALYISHSGWTVSGATGAVIALVWNYAVSATLVWRPR
ncbi:MAG TPA: glycosyltransferase family 2 protein [Acetobacteraceae bacterium]